MVAVMVKDTYSDLALDFPYEVERVLPDGRIKLKNSPALYDGENFTITYQGKRITLKEAYRKYKIGVVKARLGLS